jgi:ParB family chromosome partitioning protein
MASMSKGMAGHVLASMTDSESRPGAGRATEGQAGSFRQFEGRKKLEGAAVIALDRIVPDPDQPRKEFDAEELQQLADSIKTRGQLQPIRVRWDGATDRYVVVVGERRYRASKLAGLETIAAVVVSGEATAEDLLEDQLVENALRSDLKPIEQAMAYRTLMESRGLSQRQLAERLHVSPAAIARQVLLLELPPQIQQEVESGTIAAYTAYQLTKVEDPVEQASMARQAAAGQLSREEMKSRTHRPTAGKGGGAKAKKPIVRTIRTPLAKVTIELKKGVSADQVLDQLRIAIGLIDVDAQEAA